MADSLLQRCKKWLKDEAYPLWFREGVDPENGSFVESISLDGKAILDQPRRAMVQCRQLYCIRKGIDLGFIDKEEGRKAIDRGSYFFVSQYFDSKGGVFHSMNQDLEIHDERKDLYAQAFALFGLANAYSVLRDESLKEKAVELKNYLLQERSLSQGGFSEFSNEGAIEYSSNPHMHMFEAAIEWMEVCKGTESKTVWREFAEQILNLCLEKFICSQKKMLAENFDEKWSPILEDGKFIFEPGHQYEWSWLMGRFEKLTGSDLLHVRRDLVNLSENHGTSEAKFVYDKMWSDHSVCVSASRFWPQAERIKASLRLAEDEKDIEQRRLLIAAADEAVEVLLKYFETETKGLWYDSISEAGEFIEQPAKASSFYHIVGALTEYIELRPSQD